MFRTNFSRKGAGTPPEATAVTEECGVGAADQHIVDLAKGTVPDGKQSSNPRPSRPLKKAPTQCESVGD
jgi:hypothetical protein